MAMTSKAKRNKFGKIANPKLKTQWLKDLRSGSYKQCQDTLCDVGTKNKKAGYCCLGVLGRSIEKIKAFPIKFEEGDIRYKKSLGDSMPPANLLKEIGISHAGALHLANLNDDEGLTFRKIADFIEENL